MEHNGAKLLGPKSANTVHFPLKADLNKWLG